MFLEFCLNSMADHYIVYQRFSLYCARVKLSCIRNKDHIT